MPDRETLDVDVLFVGAGAAGLAGALHLARLCKSNNVTLRGASPRIAILEKSAEVGHHLLSGAILDPVALRELAPDYLERGCPIEGTVEEDFFYILTARDAFALPVLPAALRNVGLPIVSICRFARWLAGFLEEAGVNLFTGFPAAELLFEGGPAANGTGHRGQPPSPEAPASLAVARDPHGGIAGVGGETPPLRVVGVRTGDRGVDKRGGRKANFEPGVDVRAQVTVLCEGARGSLAKKLVATLGLDRGRFPQAYSTAVKEVWRLPKGRVPPGRVLHTLGYPLDTRTFGGGFLYSMSGDHVALGLVVGCDAEDPAMEPQRLLQDLKRHPLFAKMLDGGELTAYGAKTIPEGGWYAVPRPYADGCLIAGDAAGFVNVQRLKGIHLAMKTGMLAAETAFEALQKGDATAGVLSGFERRIRESWVYRELWPVRNFRQAYEKGLWAGLLHTGLQMATGGRGLIDPFPVRPGHERMGKRVGAQHVSAAALAKEDAAPLRRTPDAGSGRVPFDGRLTFDKRTDLFHSGTGHEEDQPCHLVVADTDVCRTRCAEEYGNPCQYFCPANVYEMAPAEGGAGMRLQINAANCLHCKTCDIMDPYQIITWITPEGGGGPRYTMM